MLFPVIKTHRIVRNNEPVMNKSKILNEKSKDTIKAFHFFTLCFFVLNFHVEYNSRSYVFLWVGSDPALFMFNMFFCCYEDKGIRKTRKKVSFYRK